MSEGVAPALAPWLQTQLSELRAQRGHALMVSGAEGLGQYALAHALARVWLCDTPTEQGACGTCDSCRSVAQRKPSKWIRVDAARAAVAFTQLTVSRARHQVVLIHPAHRLNVEAANTLLKTLEEPPGDVRFILACEALHQVLPTIRSRCHIHQMTWPSQSEAVQWLQQAVSPAPSEATALTWLTAAGGRAQGALAWAELGLTEVQWQGIPKAIAHGQVGVMASWPAALVLDTLQKVAHDTQAHWVGTTGRFFESSSLPALPHLRALEQWGGRLADWRRHVEHPFSAGLQLEAWMADCNQVFGAAHRAG